MQAFLIDFKGGSYELPILLGWNISYGDSLPCDCFEVSFIYESRMLTMLSEAVRFKALHNEETVFFGVVDEFEVSAGEKGCTVSVRGRGMAALLLDNEAEAEELYGAGLDFILDRYVYPFGISQVRKNISPPSLSLVVGSGSSCWRVLEDFLWFGCGERPRFSRDGVLLLGAEEGKRFRIDRDTAALEQTLTCKRYGVISEVLVKNKALGASSVVENTEFLARGGNCRRVVNVPRYTRFDAMRSTGIYQIRQSRAEELMLSIMLPALFAAFPGDIVELDNSITGIDGNFVVGRTNCFAAPTGEGTEIILTEREK